MSSISPGSPLLAGRGQTCWSLLEYQAAQHLAWAWGHSGASLGLPPVAPWPYWTCSQLLVYSITTESSGKCKKKSGESSSFRRSLCAPCHMENREHSPQPHVKKIAIGKHCPRLAWFQTVLSYITGSTPCECPSYLSVYPLHR